MVHAGVAVQACTDSNWKEATDPAYLVVKEMRTSWRFLPYVIVLIAMAAVLVRIVVFQHLGFTDDALIIFRYAENIAQGEGFVYNEGERVLGTTSPIYTFLLSLFAALGQSPLTTTPVINSVIEGITSAMVYIMLRERVSSHAGILGALFFSLSIHAIRSSVAGMETPLYCLFILLVFWTYARGKFNIAAILVALTMLIRIDGALIVPALLLDMVWGKKKISWQPVALFIATLLPWTLFATLYFGSPVPNTVLAKSLWSAEFGRTAFWSTLREFFFGNPLTLLFTLISCLGIYYVIANKLKLRALLIWVVLYVAFYAAVGSYIREWYKTPAFFALNLLAAAGIDYFLCSVLGDTKKIGVYVVCSVFLVTSLVLLVPREISLGSGLYRAHKLAGIWLKENTEAGDRILVPDIGYVGYISDRYIIDPVGLVSPQAFPFWQGRKEFYISFIDMVRALQPEVVVVTPYYFNNSLYRGTMADKWFMRTYAPVIAFDTKGSHDLQSQFTMLSEESSRRYWFIFERIR